MSAAITPRQKVELFCDGACLGNPGPGGWAYLLRIRTPSGSMEKESFGSDPATTNNRMELTAALRGLEALSRPCQVRIISDSQYVLKGLATWVDGWKRKGWHKADGQPVLNTELWQALDEQRRIHHIETEWVRGHAGHPENERVDRLARGAAESLKKN